MNQVATVNRSGTFRNKTPPPQKKKFEFGRRREGGGDVYLRKIL